MRGWTAFGRTTALNLGGAAAGSGQRASPANRSEDNGRQEQDQRDKKDDLRELHRDPRYAAETENRGNECDDQECDRQTDHDKPLLPTKPCAASRNSVSPATPSKAGLRSRPAR